MTTDELNKLKELAERATPKWSARENGNGTVFREFEIVQATGGILFRSTSQNDAAYIAAVFPDVVLKLIDQLAEAREVLEEYSGPNKMSETHGTLLNRFERWRTAARAYLENTNDQPRKSNSRE